ncbi:MAG: 2-C-methyl-D-erythritol 2,4-cyclodiphosphate synthase [Planctomycetales bacterium]|nr:2-C-methyl-D-erythritol 2,4-cyclodiphosphate synthase [Planctomycetales bacterium]
MPPAARRPASRIGIGHDTHRLESGGPLRLGGLTVPHDRHLVGHSDADALLHAVTDALLGAAAMGDIGELYPDTDPANRGLDSAVMLQEAWRRVRQAGWALVNLDCIIFAQRPKLGPHKAAMAARLAELLEIETNQVNVKAKTGESVGPVGREESVSTQCIVLLEQSGETATEKS